jgi:putative PEP-CTERM system TPR-repeat lipoprotein
MNDRVVWRGSARRGATLALAAMLAMLAACGGKNEPELMASAKQYIEKHDTKAAIIELKNLLEKNPQSGEARFLLGQALLESGDPVGADVELKRALEYRHPESAVAPVRARALLAMGQPRKVLDEFASLDLKDPLVDIELQVAIAQAHAALGARDEARAAVDRALAISAVYAPAVLMDARLKAASGDRGAALAAMDGLLARAPDNTDAMLLKADLLLLSKADRPAALALYRRALELRKDLLEAQASIFNLLLADKDLEGAKKQLDDIRKTRANHPRTRFMEAQLAYASGDYKQAREQLNVLRRSAGENLRVLQLSGAVEFQLGALSEAEASLSRVLQLAPGSIDARRLLAEVHLRQRQPAKALAVLKPLLEAPTPQAEVLALAAQAQLLNGDAKTAQQLFAKAAQIKPDDKRLNAAVALTQLHNGNADAAFSELERLAASDQGRSVDLALITARLQRREFDGALTAIEALARKQPDSPIPSLLRGQVLVAKRDLAGARKAFEGALAKDAKYLPAVGALAALDMQDKNAAGASKRFEDLLKADPRNARAMLAFADLKQRTGAPATEVARLLADAVAADPADPQLRVAQIDHLARTKETQAAALNAAQAAASALPGYVDVLERLGRMQLVAGDRQQALSTFGKIVSSQPDRASGHLGIASVHLASGDGEAGLRAARKAVEAEPDSAAGNRLLIAVLMQTKQPQKALEAAHQLQKRRPADGAGFIAEGDIEGSQKRWDAALAAYKAALTKSEPGAAALRLHATLVAAGRAPEAARFADGWLKDHPKDQVFRFHLGDAALSAGDLALAETRYLDVLMAQPEHALALNNVAWLKMKQNKPGALEYAERAVKVAPDQAPLMDTLAMVLSATGQHARAVEVQKQVVAKTPQLPGFRLNLAKIQLAAGDKAQARQELSELAKLKDFPGQAEAEQLLKKIDGG